MTYGVFRVIEILGAIVQHLLLACGKQVAIVTNTQMGMKFIPGLHKRYANIKMRDTLLANWIIQCGLDTGVSLRWLSTFEGPMRLDANDQVMSFAKQKDRGGQLRENKYMLFSLTLLLKDPDEISEIETDREIYSANHHLNEINDTLWLISIVRIHSIRELIRFPNNRVMLEPASSKLEYNSNDISIILRQSWLLNN